MNTQQFAGEVWLRVDNAVCCHVAAGERQQQTRTHEWLLGRRQHYITPITRRELCIQLECDTLARLPGHCSCVAGRSQTGRDRRRGTLDAVDRLPVCTVVGGTAERCATHCVIMF